MPIEGRPVAIPVETERLRLREFAPGDLDALASLHGDAELVRWIPWGPRSREEAREVLERKMTQTELREPGLGGIALAIETREGRDFVGDLTLGYNSREHSLAEIGFLLAREHHGEGYAVEAGREMLRIAFEELDFHRVIGRTDERNPASAKTLERLGMRREAHLLENEWMKGGWSNELSFAILEREWGG
jgi:RimJ/RimL family protein N-acetyltransferase